MIYVRDEMMEQEQMYALQRIKAKFLADLAVAYTNKQAVNPYAQDTIRYVSEVYDAIFGGIKKGGKNEN